jgi:hypothetical protein
LGENTGVSSYNNKWIWGVIDNQYEAATSDVVLATKERRPKRCPVAEDKKGLNTGER